MGSREGEKRETRKTEDRGRGKGRERMRRRGEEGEEQLTHRHCKKF